MTNSGAASRFTEASFRLYGQFRRPCPVTIVDIPLLEDALATMKTLADTPLTH
jgi:hypothetical protein